MATDSGPVVGPELLLAVERGNGVSVQKQVEQALRSAIQRGRLQPAQRLPSTRSLSTSLGIARGVVSEGYAQLVAEGYLESRQGAPTRVAKALGGAPERLPAASIVEHFDYDFTPTQPDLGAFPVEQWLRSHRNALRDSRVDALGYGDPRGAPHCRDLLAAYLSRARGADADPEHMILCSGFLQGFALACRMLRAHGIDEIAMEDPCRHQHRLVAEQAGLQIVPIPVDEQGLDVGMLRGSGAGAVLLTAAHQFPLGNTLSAMRRSELIDWAADDNLLIEDDYDSELRYDGTPAGALQGLAPERVLLIGSLSKLLAPGLRCGWMLTPAWLTWELTGAKAAEDGSSEVTCQLALADFLARGELDRHLRRMRRHYSRRRATLIDSLAAQLPQWVAGPVAAGLYLTITLPTGVDERELIAAAAARGVGLESLALHSYRPATEPGLVLGFGSLSEPALRRGVELLAAAAADRSFGL